MGTKDYFFVISIPRDDIIEFTSKLNSYISKVFPDKKYPFTMKPLEIGETKALAKIIINTTEDGIREFAERFFGKNFELIERERRARSKSHRQMKTPRPPPAKPTIQS